MSRAAQALLAFAVAIAVVFIVSAAFVGSGIDRSSYGDDLAEIVAGACERTGDDASSDECACVYERLSSELSFEEFEALDKATEDLNEPPQQLLDAVEFCASPDPEPAAVD